jgi:hypothetical protein
VKQNLELVAALIAILLLSAAYLLGAAGGPLAPGSLPGHGIGILGFALMLATETLYSWRKTRRRARWGQARTWLAAHIFTGIVGPYMVFLHTGFRWAGLAGILFWMTVIVVCSGFVGRYIYTSVPRTSTGDEMEMAQLEAAIGRVEQELQAWLSAHPVRFRALAEQMEAVPAVVGTGIAALLGKAGVDRRYHEGWQRAVEHLDVPIRGQASELAALLDRRRALQRQAATLANTRRLMATWHAMHVPLAVALFVAALLHVVAALYFS